MGTASSLAATTYSVDPAGIIAAIGTVVASVLAFVLARGRGRVETAESVPVVVASTDPEDLPGKLRERITSLEVHCRKHDRELDDLREIVDLLRAAQVADEAQARPRPRPPRR